MKVKYDQLSTQKKQNPTYRKKSQIELIQVTEQRHNKTSRSEEGSVSLFHPYRDVSDNYGEVRKIPQHWVSHTRPPNNMGNNNLDNENEKKKFFFFHDRKEGISQVSNNLYD